MNFNSVLEELDKLYESTTPANMKLKSELVRYLPAEYAKQVNKFEVIVEPGKDVKVDAEVGKIIVGEAAANDFRELAKCIQVELANIVAGASEVVEEACIEDLKEAADEDVEIVDEESAEEASEDSAGEIEFTEEPVEVLPRQLILECSKCGAIIIKDEADVVIDEESDLANIKDTCEYCEEAEGYKIIGVVAPYEVEVVNDVEEPTEETGESEIEFAEEPVEILPEDEEAVEEGLNAEETPDEDTTELEEGLFSDELEVTPELRQLLNSNKEVAGLYAIFEPARRLLYDEQDFDIFNPKHGDLYTETKETLATKGSKLNLTKKFYLEKIIKVADLGKKLLDSKGHDKIKFKKHCNYTLVVPNSLYNDVSTWIYNLKEVCKNLKVVK